MTIRHILRLLFHKDSLALIASIVFLWFTIGLLADFYIDKKHLIPHEGRIVRIDSVVTKVKKKLFTKTVTKELRLTLNNEPKYYTYLSTTNFYEITSKIKLGDHITLFTKPKFLGIFGMKKSSAINHLLINNTAIIDFEEYRDSISGLFIITLVASVLFFVYFYIRFKRRYIILLSDTN